MIDRRAVITTIMPRIIWYTEGGTMVRAMNIRVDAQKSQDAGSASQSGLIFVSFFF